MKMKKLALYFVLNIAIYTGVAQADIRVHSASSLKVGEDACSNFEGLWEGDAKILSYCRYHGTVDAKPTGEPGVFNLTVDIHSKTLFCPPDEVIHDLMATCNAGNLRVNTRNADLNGLTDGHSMNLAGTITLDNGTKVKVDYLNLNK